MGAASWLWQLFKLCTMTAEGKGDEMRNAQVDGLDVLEDMQ